MFQRLTYESWTHGVPVLAFCLTFGVFLAITIRALLMSKTHREHLADLPLETESEPDLNNDEH